MIIRARSRFYYVGMPPGIYRANEYMLNSLARDIIKRMLEAKRVDGDFDSNRCA